MDLKVLIASPDRSFGEQISQKLQEANYKPLLTTNAAEAAFITQDEKFAIAILDCQLPDPGPEYLAKELRAHSNDLRIIFIHSEDASNDPVQLNSAQDIYLPRPFFMPDLLEVINLWGAEKKTSINEALQSHQTQEIPPKLAWLQDVNQVAQYLTRLSLEIDAQAALIIRDAKIWAYAGQLSKIATEELAQFVGHHWANNDGSDLARFVRLETTGREYMLYATHLGSGFILTLSFKTEMPFSKMRAQTGEMARKLISHMPDQSSSTNTILTETKQNSPLEFSPSEVEPEKQQSAFLPETGVNFSQIPETAPYQDADPLAPVEVMLEPGSFAQHNLAYSCILLPRLPDHQLTGVITGLLTVEMARLCLAFGWRLENLSIRPEYLHWVVSVTPDVSASIVIDNIREQTSTLLYDEIPRLAKENPSGDFWAPGFMVVHGRRSISRSLVQEYIRHTRKRQGIDRKTDSENNA